MNIPEICLPNPNPRGLPPRVFHVTGDSMAPSMRHGEILLLVPVETYHCEGVYLLSFMPRHSDLYRCEVRPGCMIRVWKDNPDYRREPLMMTREAFEACVLAQVAFQGRIVAGGLLPEGWMQ